MTLVLNVPEFWIYQGYEYASGFEYDTIVNIHKSSEYAMVTQGWKYTWIIPEYAWMWLVMSEYAWICVNLPKSAWMAPF